jgi:tRNA threonylcarbamoyladenosine biosynthesis protein TsaE
MDISAESSIMPAMNAHTTHSPDETVALGRELAKRFRPGDCLALIGNLGAGKTCLVRGLAEGLGCDAALVSSPTYVLLQEYPGAVSLYHLDLYRMVDPAAELADLGLEEMLAEGVVAIEWAERALEALPRPLHEIHIAHTGDTTRSIRVARA